MGNLGFPEILLISLVIILLFGARRIPEFMKGLGEGVRSFRKGMSGEDDSQDSKAEKKP